MTPYLSYKKLLIFAFAILFAGLANAQLKAGFTADKTAGCAPLIVHFQDVSTGSATSYKWDLGNGVVTTAQNPNTVYFNPGSYTVKLVITKTGGKDSIIKTAYINVYDKPAPDFSISNPTGCIPLTVNFTDKSKAGAGTISNWFWDFGDGNIASTANTSHVYTTSGSNTVVLQVTNSFGCKNEITKPAAINASDGVTADFSYVSPDVCNFPSPVQFTNNCKGTGVLKYNWNFGDSTSSTQTSPSHIYNKTGTYSVKLTVSNANGCTDIITKQITILHAQASFTAADTTCLGTNVLFTSTTNPSPASVVWDFGDGSSATAVNGSHTYNTVGTYQVLMVSNFAGGCSDSVIKKITVVSGPVAAFGALDSVSCAIPFKATFQNKSTGSGNTYKWDFGDGKTASGVIPPNNYTAYGSYNVTLTATNKYGCTDTKTINNCVVLSPMTITGISGINDKRKCIPLTIDPQVMVNGIYSITKYNWNFGDGATSTLANPTHIYTKEGNYIITVTIETIDGCSATYTMPEAISLGHRPTADFTVSDTAICYNQFITATSTSTNGPIDYLQWNGMAIEPGSNSFTKLRFSDTGYFSITLKAFNNLCADTITKTNIVYVKGPKARFSFTQTCINKTDVGFTDNSVAGLTRIWDFGDGTTDNTLTPLHSFDTSGIYTVTMHSINGTCNDSTTSTVRVISDKGAIAVSKTEFCRNENINLNILNVDAANFSAITWNMGNGDIFTTSSINTAYTYTNSGDYKITAILLDKNNCSDTIIFSDTIHVYGGVANFKTSVTGACQNNSIDFLDASVNTTKYPIVSWSWNFGDGNTQKNTTPIVSFSHQYKDTGYFSASLVIKDAFGCTDSMGKSNLILITRPYSAFSLSDSIVCPGKNIQFTDNSTGRSLSYTWHMGDGYQISGYSNPTYGYTIPGTYSPVLSIKDINGCMDSVHAPFNVKVAFPKINYSISDSFAVCPPLMVNFTNSSSLYNTLTWDFGDGSFSNQLSPTHLYTYPGIYKAKLVISGNGVCTDSLVRTITIKGPTGQLQYDSSAVCLPFVSTIKVNSKNASGYYWDYGDGTTESNNLNVVKHSYTTGEFVPKIILSDIDGCKVPIIGKDTLKVFDLNTQFKADRLVICDSGAVLFTNFSATNDSITKTQWNINNNSVLNGMEVYHQFNTTGTYNITMTTTTLHGCKDSINFTQPIKVVASPVISISAKSDYCVQDYFNINGNEDIKDTSALAWIWDFKNGITNTNKKVDSMVYQTAGLYKVSLTATNSSGCATTVYQDVNARPLPFLDAGIDTVICRYTSYALAPSYIDAYNWKSDISIKCVDCRNPVVSPDSTRYYYLLGKDQYGCRATDSVKITVVQPSSVSVSRSDTICLGQQIKFTANGTDNYQWYPSLYLSNANAANPVCNPGKDTTMTYTVIGSDYKKCFSDTGKINVKVYPIPAINFAEKEITMPSGGNIQLKAVTSPDVKYWRWTPQYGLSNALIANPLAAPKATTTYTCTATNDGGCTSLTQLTINVVCGNNNYFIPNTFSPNNDGVNDQFYVRGNGLFNIKSFMIFNRLGQQVYAIQNTTANKASDGWNGTYKGSPVDPDVYIYMIEIICENNTVIPVKGSITLLR
ncbi:PKD domain-containing protein [Limnovirga soli]|uniref:PKD domain-containing protein n=1 Tax=Limnovirga soli TaxID=2656915 RepID=A0A8J8FE68_9BACT|nr:PKD domain-containing protein [Limnovirga soli]NNV55857.1 PKD domain-containing protein [Limnovirga soli]